MRLTTSSSDQAQLLDATPKHHRIGDENVDHSRPQRGCPLQMAPICLKHQNDQKKTKITRK